MNTEPRRFRRAVSEMWRERILEGAAQVFAAKGFHRATTKEIARAAGVAEGTIYNYFENKRAILFALVEKVAAQSLRTALLESPPDDPCDFFRMLIHDRYRFFQEHGTALAPVMAEVFTDPALRKELYREVFRPLVELLERYLESQIEAGRFRALPVATIAYGIIGAVLFNVVMAFAGLDPRCEARSADELADGLVEWLAAGLSMGRGKAGAPADGER